VNFYLFDMSESSPKLVGTIQHYKRFSYQQRDIAVIGIESPTEQAARDAAENIQRERKAWRALIQVGSMDMIGQKG
jgi:hypothetical protein